MGLARTSRLRRGFGPAFCAKKEMDKRQNKERRRRDSVASQQSVGARVLRVSNFPSPFPPLARTRDNSRVLARLRRQKGDGQTSISFLAQKAGFEPALQSSHTTPLAGEPLEPLGYFCIAHFTKAILLYHIFSSLSKLFEGKSQKSFFIFSLHQIFTHA